MGKPQIEIAVVIAATPQTGRGALAIPVEDGQWLVLAAGYGDRPPCRSRGVRRIPGYAARSAAVAELTTHLEPVSDGGVLAGQSGE